MYDINNLLRNISKDIDSMGRRKKKYVEVELDIESIGFEGVAVARKDDMVHFVKGAVPGDKVKVWVTKKKKSYAECKLLKVLEPSDLRIPARCQYFDNCGGCSWQNLEYPLQLEWKKQHVIDAFTRLAKLEAKEYIDTMPSPEVFNYRNKMEFSFGASRWLTAEEVAGEGDIEDKNFALGLHIPGRYDKILDIDICHIQGELGNEILKSVKQACKDFKVTAHNLNTHEGFLKNLIIRRSLSSGMYMVILLTDTPNKEEEWEFLDWLQVELPMKYPDIDSLSHAVNDTRSPVAAGEIRFTVGKEYIEEEILGIKYRISPFSFFQTNSSQLDNFIGEIIDYGDIEENEVVWDLYCGTGSISLPTAKKAKEVYGIELVESSIKDAKANTYLNEIKNAEFFCADLHAKDIPDLLDKLPRPDTIIIDPPRAGMHKNLVSHIEKIAPEKIVYVSCNPTTQARDIELLSHLYTIDKVRTVDMFPHTYHVESIARLTKK